LLVKFAMYVFPCISLIISCLSKLKLNFSLINNGFHPKLVQWLFKTLVVVVP